MSILTFATKTLQLDGVKIISAAPAPTAPPGVVAEIGSLYLRTSGELYQKTGAAATQWTRLGVTGPQGPTGPQGATGETGLAGVTLAVPSVSVTKGSWKADNADGGGTTSYGSPYVRFLDVPDEWFTNELIDARLELMRLSVNGHFGGGSRHRKERRWIHPHDPEIGLERSGLRGPSKHPNVATARRTEWKLLGLHHGQGLRAEELSLTSFFRVSQITVRDPNTGNETTDDVIAPSGYSKRNSRKFAPHPWRARPLRQAFAFRYSVRDIRMEDPRYRIAGPLSGILIGSPLQRPVWFNPASGQWESRKQTRLKWSLGGVALR